MSLKPGTNRQLPDQAILDFYNKQAYLGNSFAVATSFVAGTGSEAPLLYLSNPASNSSQNGQAGNLGCFIKTRAYQCDTQSATAIFKLYLNPTSVSGGSSLTPQNLRPAWGTVSKMSALKSPTVGGNGTLISTFATNVQVTESGVIIILDPGYSLLVTQTVSAANVAAEFVWDEM